MLNDSFAVPLDKNSNFGSAVMLPTSVTGDADTSDPPSVLPSRLSGWTCPTSYLVVAKITSMATRTPAEARLAIHEILTEILVSLAVDDETTDAEVEGFEEDMGEVADLMISALGIEVVSVDNEDGTQFTVKMEILEGDPLEGLDED